MINSKLYDRYEGEDQVIFCDEQNNKQILWEGHIYVLMERMFDQGYKILADFYSREDDDAPWMIPDIKSAIAQFEATNLEKMKQDNFTKNFPMVIKEIVEFLLVAQNTNQKVHMDRE